MPGDHIDGGTLTRDLRDFPMLEIPRILFRSSSHIDGEVSKFDEEPEAA